MTVAIGIWLALALGASAFLGYAFHAVGQGANPWAFVVAAPLVAVAVPAAFTAVYFALAWGWRARRPREHRLGVAGSVQLYVGEVGAIAASWPRMALARWLARDPPPAPARLPVLLLHGVLCNAGVWVGMRARLRTLGIGPIYTLTFAPPLASIDAFADQMAAKVAAILAATGADRVAVVGHSMGGLVARACLRRHGPQHIALLMTLGTPHHGSVHAWLCAGRCLAEMRPGSAWLAELNRDEGTPAPVRFVSLWSWHDSMVAPQTSSRYQGALNVELEGIGHNALLGEQRVFERVADELMSAQANAQGRGLRPAEE
jgi:triacylglycerol esterase/lipase EstA (alpha/beta hydrolase family)